MNKLLEILYRNDYCVFMGSESAVIDVYETIDKRLEILNMLMTKRIDLYHIQSTGSYEAFCIVERPVFDHISKKQYYMIKEEMERAKKEKTRNSKSKSSEHNTSTNH